MWNAIFLCKQSSNMVFFAEFCLKIFTFWRGRGIKACRALRVTSGSHRWSTSLPKRSEFTSERRRWGENHLPLTVTLPCGRKMEMCNWIQKSGWFTQGGGGGGGGPGSYWGLMENMNKTQKKILSGIYWLFISSDGGFVAEVTGIQQQRSSILILGDLSSALWDQPTPNLHLKFRGWTQTCRFKKSFMRPPRYPRNKARNWWSCWSLEHSPPSFMHRSRVCNSDLTLTFHESQTSTCACFTYINVNSLFPTGEQLG